MRISKRTIQTASFVGLLLISMFMSGTALGQGQVVAKQTGQQLLLANTDVGVEIIQGKEGFYLSRIYGVASGQDFLPADSAKNPAKLWELELRRDKGLHGKGITIASLDGGQLSSSIDRKASEATLHLWWKNIKVADQADALDVEVTVTVKQGDPLSRWRINVTNRSTVHGLWEVAFPMVDLAPLGKGPESNYFTIGKSRGIVIKNPIADQRGFAVGGHRGILYPGSLNMQFQSLYDQSGPGVYLAAHDGQGYRKRFYFYQVPEKQIIKYKIAHYPANMGYPAENYQMTYDVCIGSFIGDWYDACLIYRSWALKQRWCQYGPVRTRKNMPKWFKESPLVLKAQTPLGNKDVIQAGDRMVEFLNFIGMDMGIDWYTWQKYVPEQSMTNMPDSIQKVPERERYHDTNVHNGSYPVMPALEAFASTSAKISKAGGHVKAFVPAKLYDPGMHESGPFSKEARPNIVRNADGTDYILDEWSCWMICYEPPWWRNRLKDEIVALMKNENAGGMYFDTFYGGYYQCFNTEHGHSHGGGNDMYLAARKMSDVVWGGMKKADPESVATGEKCSETAIDLLDGQLLHWSVWPDMAPLWAVVYGDYTRWCGNILAPGPDKGGGGENYQGYYIHLTALFTEGGQMGRLRFDNIRDDWLKDFDAGSKYTERMKFIRKLCHYWKQNSGGRFLAYGHLLRPLQLTSPNPMPTFSYNETSAYVRGCKEGLITVPALMNGVFETHDGDLGVFIVNVTDKPLTCSFQLTPDRYPISKLASYTVTPIDQNAKRGKTSVQKGEISHTGTLAAYDVLFLEIKKQ